MPSKYPISKAEFKRRVRMVYECWPPELLQANVSGFRDEAGCIMQIALETQGWGGHEMNGLVEDVSGNTLAVIARKHDTHQYAEVIAAVEAL